MAVKLSGSVSRKVPIPGLDYSSQSYSAGLEIEISSADAGVVQAQLAQLYASLSRGIDAQITSATSQEPAPVQYNGNGNGHSAPAPLSPPPPQPHAPLPVQQHNGYATKNRVAAVNGARRIKATEAQVKCIFAICKSQGLDMAGVLAEFNVADARDLHVAQASRLIDQLKAQNGNSQAAH